MAAQKGQNFCKRFNGFWHFAEGREKCGNDGKSWIFLFYIFARVSIFMLCTMIFYFNIIILFINNYILFIYHVILFMTIDCLSCKHLFFN